MSRRFQRPAFKTGGPFVVRTGFLFDGRWRNPGEDFPHAKVKQARLKGLYRRRRIDLTESVGRITDPAARVIAQHWSKLDDKEVIRFCYKMTGTRRRNPDIARAELATLEEAGALNAWDTGRETG